jgi:hypothetical protein
MRFAMQDEDKTVIQTLYLFIVIALIGSILILASALMTSHGVFNTFALSGSVGVITCLVVLFLLNAKYFSLPRVILPSAVYLLATYLIFTGATVGVRDDAVLLYSLVVAMAGLLLGMKGVVIFGVLSVAVVVGSVYAEVNGFLVNHITEKTTTYNTLVNAGVIYSLTFGMMYILVNILTSNLVKMRLSQQELTRANQELLTVRESLEQQVTERTRAAEIARIEAELARHEAESQVWLTRGQAQLAEQVRGDLDMHTLSNKIISHLSQYIGAQVGALFIASGDLLILTGRYAYVEHSGQKKEFYFGENLIGEAAKANHIILVNDIPADAPVISSALGETLPRQILIIPLELNDQVFGALEFATLTQFKPEHETLLKRVSESVATALQTAQTRVVMSELLAQSQTRGN